MEIDKQRELFEKFCIERFEATSTSKTISKEKGHKIIQVLQDHPEADQYGPKFKFWVKQRGFRVMSYPPLGVTDVLCVPAKKPVSLVKLF